MPKLTNAKSINLADKHGGFWGYDSARSCPCWRTGPPHITMLTSTTQKHCFYFTALKLVHLSCFNACLIIIKKKSELLGNKKGFFFKIYIYIFYFFHVIINGDSLCTYKVFYM